MNNVKVSHECPLALLYKVSEYNDYDYCLVHLLDKHPEYATFFERQLGKGRHVLMDNSIFELGEAFDWDRYVYWINRLCPTEYIIPDVLEDYMGTITQCALWLEACKDVMVDKTIGVVQGKTYAELAECYEFMSTHVDKIAISFDYSYFLKADTASKDKWVKFMAGRVGLINQLYAEGIWNSDKEHHLLGCSLPQEFKMYDWKKLNIVTLDTSNPVQQAILGFKYSDAGTLNTKNAVKVADSFEATGEEQWDTIVYNILKFKENCSR